MQRHLIQILLILSILIGGALPAFPAKNFNVKNDNQSFLFVDGTYGNVGIGTNTPIGVLEVFGGATAPAKVVNINGTFDDIAGSRTGLYVDMTASTANGFLLTGSWSEVRTTAGVGETYTSAVAGAYAESLHSGLSTVTDLMGLYALANQTGGGPVTNAYGIVPEIWKGAGGITNAYGMYFQGVPDTNGDTGLTLGSVTNQYGLGIGHLTIATNNVGILLDDNTMGSSTAADFGILQEATEPNSFAGNIGIGTTAVTAQLTLHSTGNDLIDSHVNEDTTGAKAIESHYRVGNTDVARTMPSDVQKFRFFAGTGAFQEVAQIAVTTPGIITGSTIGGQIDFYTQGADALTPRMTIDNINVGIGSTAPQAKLEVGTATSIVAGSIPAAAINGNLVVDGKIYGDGSGLTGVAGSISGLTATRVPVASGASTLVDSVIYEVGGNIGIGTVNPGQKLEVNGNIKLSDQTLSPDSVTFDSTTSLGLRLANSLGYISLTPLGSSWAHIYTDRNNFIFNRTVVSQVGFASYNTLDLNLLTGLGGTARTRMTILETSGNVGVGTTVPVAKLHIGAGGTAPDVMSITGDDAYIKGNLEVDGKIYGDGSELTGLAGGLVWSEVTGTSASMSVGNGYIVNNAGLVTLTLPATASVGTIVSVVGKGAGGWLIAQNASGVIHFGNQSSTTGIGGSIASVATYDSVELICVVANNEWVVRSSVGNITVN